MKRGLIIEDDPGFVQNVIDVLDSLGHHAEVAECLADARRLIDEQQFDYYLVDLEIPVVPKGKARTQNGEHAIAEIFNRYGPAGPPILVVTGKGLDSPLLAAQTMQLGAVNYITKPLPTTGETLDKAIMRALERREDLEGMCRQNMYRSTAEEPTPFSGGEMVFHDDHITLCGVKITRGNGFGYAMAIMEYLAKKNSSGQRERVTGQVLAEHIDSIAVLSTVTSCIHYLRHEISRRFKKHLNVECGHCDVIDRDEQGYSLRPWIIVDNRRHETNHVPATLPNRQKWILDQLAKGVRLSRKQVEKHFKIREKTAKRELTSLTTSGQIQYDRSAGHYCLKKKVS